MTAIGLQENAFCTSARARTRVAIGRGQAVDDGCAHAAIGCFLADAGCERSRRRSASSAVLENCAHHGCIDAEDGCFDATDGCSLAAAMRESAADGRVDADARRRLVHDGPLFASVTEEFSASGCKLVHDGCHEAPVVCELAGIARESADDGCEKAIVDRRDVAVACEDAAVGCRDAAVGDVIAADG